MGALALAATVATETPAVPGIAADFSSDNIWVYLVKAVLIIVFLLTSVLMALWFERRLVARMQVRVGPNVHGPLGLLQAVADAMKLLMKEDITVKMADKVVYIIAPMISVFCSLLIYAVIPFGPEVRIPFTDFSTPAQLTDFPVAVLYILACAALGVYGIVLGGWSSGSTYPLLGGVRSTAQIISYELAMGLSLVSVFLLAGSMSTSEIVSQQERFWYALPLLPAFILYIISMIGETNRLPFDLPEAEGELVSGYMTEYSSMKFAWFFLAEYINMLNVSAVATTLFFGGWRAPWPLSAINDGMFNQGWWPILWFLAKVWFFMFIFVWVRGTLLRFRYDQFMKLGWKILIPVALVWLVVVAIYQGVVEFGEIDRQLFIYASIALFVIAILGLVVSSFTTKAEPEAEKAEAAPFDAFADGFPVPPLPGQQLPPSPRAARRAAAAAAAATAVLEVTAESDTTTSTEGTSGD
ncbi:NADH-quinone oxidoreductase subunit NuoH [Sanguibacter sp. HDW7]|uniref:NADH-quinone oxidoreductase subunit NuoH n=1 Tax=Sanguibacter sp. HDW7 TaxID=2714931 RepID=UPI00140C215D|nr:NADH-quinone oxidoreductase subunit NuoH [Sanguibacter sp. HDW7]QIK82608.1 NADH-quinone oxidoreductase subunit NuoH [Sanguibacter sp. HDW7]